MDIDFLYDLTDNGVFPDADPKHLVRLFNFTSEEAEILAGEIKKLISQEKGKLQIDQLSIINKKECFLTFEICDADHGIDLAVDLKNFKCKLTKATFHNMIWLIERFRNKSLNGYQWLYDPSDFKVDLLLSPGGTW